MCRKTVRSCCPNTLNLRGSILSKQTCAGQTRNIVLIINSKWSKPIWWSKKTMILISHLFNFSAVCLIILEFWLWKKFFDMVQTLQRNQVEKMYFDIVFNLSLHHVGEFEPCQTWFNIFTLFLSPSWRHGSKIFDIFFVRLSQSDDRLRRSPVKSSV